jgi:hypothetical protein
MAVMGLHRFLANICSLPYTKKGKLHCITTPNSEQTVSHVWVDVWMPSPAQEQL